MDKSTFAITPQPHQIALQASIIKDGLRGP
jgi:hypothetical protein